eukprot:NODE_8_length_66115_cov_0.981823.p52 type:complete len:134 gc:universal NODE_8_length_66115_cov_0.981823:34977-35378(+)
MRQQIQTAFKEAFKSKDKLRLNAIKQINAQLQLADKKKHLSDSEIQDLILKLVKQREESIQQFSKSDREDLKEIEVREKNVFLEFLPKQLTKSEIVQILETMKGKSIKDIMKEFPYSNSVAPRKLIKQILDEK